MLGKKRVREEPAGDDEFQMTKTGDPVDFDVEANVWEKPEMCKL
nr:uncharacterized protein CI109_002348 [Kwoniella shandongensis]KAA5529454.1 hypothetical protein CI109_002348 [Kwoniella shandongensis]